MCPLVPTETDADGWTKVLRQRLLVLVLTCPLTCSALIKVTWKKIVVNYNKIHRYQEIGQQITDSWPLRLQCETKYKKMKFNKENNGSLDISMSHVRMYLFNNIRWVKVFRVSIDEKTNSVHQDNIAFPKD